MQTVKSQQTSFLNCEMRVYNKHFKGNKQHDLNGSVILFFAYILAFNFTVQISGMKSNNSTGVQNFVF